MEGTGRAAVAEFVATFALVFVGAGAVILNANGQLDLTGVALAHGLVLAIMVSITVHISGGMVNPAVAVSLWVTGKVSSPRAGALILAELAGAIAAAFLLRFLVPSEMFDSGNGGIPALGDGITIGDRTFVNFNCTMLDGAPISIGDECLLAAGVQLITATHPVDPVLRRAAVEQALPVTIADGVWLGAGALVLPGVSIGENTVIGAGSVVTGDLPAGVVRQWAEWCDTPDYVRGALGLESTYFHRIAAPMWFYDFTDDTYAPSRAAAALRGWYTHAKSTHRVIAPADLGLRRVGHFGPFRAGITERLWDELLGVITGDPRPVVSAANYDDSPAARATGES